MVFFFIIVSPYLLCPLEVHPPIGSPFFEKQDGKGRPERAFQKYAPPDDATVRVAGGDSGKGSRSGPREDRAGMQHAREMSGRSSGETTNPDGRRPAGARRDSGRRVSRHIRRSAVGNVASGFFITRGFHHSLFDRGTKYCRIDHMISGTFKRHPILK